jgi:hypothetical protein
MHAERACAACVAEHRGGERAGGGGAVTLPAHVDTALDALTPEALAAAVPKRVALFVEPSPFTCASLLLRCTAHCA